MAKLKGESSSNPPRNFPPALTPEARENQLIALAVDLAEKQLIDGTASSQVITHYLKLASTKERLEKEILVEQKKLISAKTKSIEATETRNELYAKAIAAIHRYSGNNVSYPEIERGGMDDEY